jgi:hypothetical protein
MLVKVTTRLCGVLSGTSGTSDSSIDEQITPRDEGGIGTHQEIHG